MGVLKKWLQATLLLDVFSSRKTYASCLFLFLIAIPLIKLDYNFSEFLHQSFRPWDIWLQRITMLGDGRVLLPFCLVVFGILQVRRSPFKIVPWISMVSFALSGAITQLLKNIFGRPRPYLTGDVRYGDVNFGDFNWLYFRSDFDSFPSGHTTAIFSVLWVFLSLPLSRNKKILIFCIALLVTLSRVALAKHFMADVLAGAAVGTLVAQTLILLCRRYAANFLEPQ